MPAPLTSPTLTDGVVTLRSHRPDDVPRMVEQCRDPESIAWTMVPTPYDERDAEEYGMRILPAGWVDDATTNQLPTGAKDAKGQPQSYGYFWWPREDSYAAIGIYGQGISVYPGDNLVIAINSAYVKPTDRTQSAKQAALFKAIRDAANGP